MICVTVTPTSRTLAKVDMLNAARQGDLIELCLDHLAKEPDIPDLLKAVEKPVLISCRRKEDGGQWEGSEEQRLQLLRQAIIAAPDYVELDLDVAQQIRRFGQVQRVISFTRMDRPEHDIDTVFDEAASADADVVKFTWPTPTLDDAWPLLAAVSQKRRLPIVGMGLGQAELTFSLLGRKYGSPWIYAALEQGMEAHPGQVTVSELKDVYRFDDINRKTVFIAVAGFGESQRTTTHILNNAFAELEMNVRCLPLEVGNLKLLAKMLDTLKVKAIIAGGQLGPQLVPLAAEMDETDRQSQYVDLLLNKDGSWKGYNTLWRSGIRALEEGIGRRDSSDRPLDRKNVMILGSGGIAQALVHAVGQRKGLVSICSTNDKEARQIAARMECRLVPYQNMYDTLVDVAVIADRRLRCGDRQQCINPSYFKDTMTVLDVSDPPNEHPLFEEARLRGCKTIGPRQVYIDQIKAQFRAVTGKDLPHSALEAGLAEAETR